jgi:hypothetical protein
MTRIFTTEELRAEGHRRFGPDVKDFAFECPRCRDVATVQDFIDAGYPQAAGQECLGRSLGALQGSAKPDRRGLVRGNAPRGCDWCAYGVFPGPWTIRMDNGKTVFSFPMAAGHPAPEEPLAVGQLGQSILPSP